MIDVEDDTLSATPYNNDTFNSTVNVSALKHIKQKRSTSVNKYLHQHFEDVRIHTLRFRIWRRILRV